MTGRISEFSLSVNLPQGSLYLLTLIRIIYIQGVPEITRFGFVFTNNPRGTAAPRARFAETRNE